MKDIKIIGSVGEINNEFPPEVRKFGNILDTVAAVDEGVLFKYVVDDITRLVANCSLVPATQKELL